MLLLLNCPWAILPGLPRLEIKTSNPSLAILPSIILGTTLPEGRQMPRLPEPGSDPVRPPMHFKEPRGSFPVVTCLMTISRALLEKSVETHKVTKGIAESIKYPSGVKNTWPRIMCHSGVSKNLDEVNHHTSLWMGRLKITAYIHIDLHILPP